MSNVTLDGEPIDEPTFYGTYKIARLFAYILSGFGWLLVGVTIFTIAIFPSLNSQPITQEIGYIGLLVAVFMAFFSIMSGIAMIALGQIMRATVDSADYNAQQLELQFFLARDDWERRMKHEQKMGG